MEDLKRYWLAEPSPREQSVADQIVGEAVRIRRDVMGLLEVTKKPAPSISSPAGSVAAAVGLVVDELAKPNDWYLFAAPEDAPVFVVEFLDQPKAKLPALGSDPYTMDFDTVEWKLRAEMRFAMPMLSRFHGRKAARMLMPAEVGDKPWRGYR